MRKQMILLWGLIGLLIFSSCASRKNFVYLNDMVMGVDYPFDAKHEAVIHSGDRLGITVSCKNPELAIPFNVQGGGIFRLMVLVMLRSQKLLKIKERDIWWMRKVISTSLF